MVVTMTNDKDIESLIETMELKVAEALNCLEGLKILLGFDADSNEVKPIVRDFKKEMPETKETLKIKKRIEKFLKSIDKKEGGIQYNALISTWLTKNNNTGELEAIFDEIDTNCKLDKYVRPPEQWKYKPDDPDVLVRKRIDDFVQKAFVPIFKELKQHRVDISYAKGKCIIGIR